MNEKPWTLKTPDNKIIYGRHFLAGQKMSDRVIVFVHGLPGCFLDYPNYVAAMEFARRGYDCIVFSLYDWMPSARRLKDCTLSSFGRDIDFIIDKKAKRYKKVFMVGHSYGGPSILHAKNKRITAVSLWDPTYNIAALWDPKRFKKKAGMLIDDGGAYDIIFPKRLYNDALKFDLAGCRKLARNFLPPMQVLLAEKGILIKFKESYHTHHLGLHESHVMKGADHSFTTQKLLHAAIGKAESWFNKF